MPIEVSVDYEKLDAKKSTSERVNEMQKQMNEQAVPPKVQMVALIKLLAEEIDMLRGGVGPDHQTRLRSHLAEDIGEEEAAKYDRSV